MSMNKVCLIGRLTKDPRITQTNQKTCARFTLAIDGLPNAKGEKQADFVPVTAWGRLAEVIGQYCNKGRQIAIIGRLHTWRQEANGETHFGMDVTAEQMDLLSSASTANQGTSMANPASPNTCTRVASTAPNDPDEEDDELPF